MLPIPVTRVVEMMITNIPLLLVTTSTSAGGKVTISAIDVAALASIDRCCSSTDRTEGEKVFVLALSPLLWLLFSRTTDGPASTAEGESGCKSIPVCDILAFDQIYQPTVGRPVAQKVKKRTDRSHHCLLSHLDVLMCTVRKIPKSAS